MPNLPGTGQFNQDDLTGGPYLVYRNESTIVWDGGALEMPVANVTGGSTPATWPGYNLPAGQRQPVEVVATSAPHGYRLVEFDMLRWGAPPKIPDPTPGPNETVKTITITTAAPLIQPDGISYVQSARGRYVYILTVPPWATLDRLPGTSTPASVDTPDLNGTTTEQFNYPLVDHGGNLRSS